MTDYTKLIEQLRSGKVSYYEDRSADAIAALQKEVSTLDVLLEECKMDWSGDVTQIKAEHKREIEALQAENERLKQELDKAQDEIHCAESSLEAFSCEFEAEVFNQGFDCLGEFVQALWTASNKQRDALQAKLDAMGKGEPVAWIKYLIGAEAKPNGQCYEIVFVACEGYEPLYAAPKALAPRFAECRIELVNAIHTLASNYENRLGRLDPEDRKLADGDIAHAMATAAKWNWNGNGIGGTP